MYTLRPIVHRTITHIIEHKKEITTQGIHPGHLHIYKYIHRYYSPTDKLQGKIGHKKKATTEGRGGQRHGAPGDLWDRYKADRLPINYNVWSITKRISQHKVWEGGGLLHQLDRPLIDNRVGSNKRKYNTSQV